MDEWDDELSELPAEIRRRRLRRGAYWSLCAGLVTLIILTVVFVGDDTKSVATVGADVTSTTEGPSTTGFATSLPVGVTATSLSDATTTSSSSTTTTLTGVVVLPKNTTTTTSTTTTTPPKFFFSASHAAVGQFTGISSTPPASCGAPPSLLAEDFIFSTPSPGNLTIKGGAQSGTGTGPIDPSGSFSVPATNLKGTYSGQLPLSTTGGTVVTGTLVDTAGPCTNTYSVKWTFSS